MTTYPLVATLVAGPGFTLDVQFVDDVVAQTGAAETDWLADGLAVDLFYGDQTQIELADKLSKVIADRPIDKIIQNATGRKKHLLIADMESTLIEQEMLDELAAMAGIGTHVADITRRAMNGELDFVAALQERVGLLAGLSTDVLDSAAGKITLMPGAKELLGTMKKNHAHTLIVSGGFTYFVDAVLKSLPFHDSHANILEVSEGKITGKVILPVLDRERKKTLLLEACTAQNITVNQTVAVGDGANDIPMLAACNDAGGLGVAYHAKPVVHQAIPQRINFGDLRVLLFAQGYPESEFVCA